MADENEPFQYLILSSNQKKTLFFGYTFIFEGLSKIQKKAFHAIVEVNSLLIFENKEKYSIKFFNTNLALWS